tara:strand:+ start:3267 stop:3446 length:180 start_codon:yes stop_codon:yes gene_type:complete
MQPKSGHTRTPEKTLSATLIALRIRLEKRPMGRFSRVNKPLKKLVFDAVLLSNYYRVIK